MMRHKNVTILVGLAVICVGFVATWWIQKPRHLLPYGTGSGFNAEITETDSLLALGYKRLYEFKGPAYSNPSILYTAQSRLISVGSLRDSPVNVVVGDDDGWLHFPGTDVDPIQVIGGAVFACGITAPKDSLDCTIVAVGHDGIQDAGTGGEVRIVSFHDQVVKPGKKFEFESMAMSLCIAHKSETIIVGFSGGDLVHIDLNTDQQKIIKFEGGFGQCVLSHDESLLAIEEYESVSVRRVSNLEDVIARIKVDGINLRICWHPTEPDILLIAEPEVGIKLLNVSSNEVKYIENKDFTSPVVIWVPQGQKQANILDRAWNLVTVDLE